MKLNFKKSGEGSPLIIIHGLFGTLDNWTSIARQLSEQYTVYLIDQRNHGRSPHSDEFSYELMADDLKQFIIQLNIENPTILGHSMGGKTAMKFAVQFPNLLNNLIVVDIAPIYYPLHHQKIIEGLYSLPLESIKNRNEADLELSKYIEIVGVRQFLLKNLYRKEDKSFGWRMNLDSITNNLKSIGDGLLDEETYDGKTLFIRGLNSDYIKDSHFEKISLHFSDYSVFSVENAGHWVHAEAPKTLIEQIGEFMS